MAKSWDTALKLKWLILELEFEHSNSELKMKKINFRKMPLEEKGKKKSRELSDFSN